MDYIRERLGELLVKGDLITEVELESVLEYQSANGGKIGEILVNQLIVTEDQIAETLARQKGLKHVSLTSYKIDHSAVNLLPERMDITRLLLPIGFEEESLVVAMADPLDIASIDDVEMRTGYRVIPVVAGRTQILYAIDKYVSSADAFQDVVETSIDADSIDEAAIAAADDVPIVRLVNQLIRDGVREGASDIHLEPQEDKLVVRVRIDGVLQEAMTLPPSSRSGVTSRIKIMAEMDISERRRPQDGRIAVKVGDRPVDIRVASLPTPLGESLVLRILNSELSFRALSDVGMSTEDYDKVLKMLNRPYGALLIAGPTGSGKSTTLYGALKRLNEATRKIITVEDPIEYRMTGVTQMSVNTRIGLTFASGLRTILRSDPDIVMVGEIRDPETAEISIRAALTGHLVLSSVHTNDAPGALTRLTDMGVPPYVTSTGLVGVVAQRLVRRLCPHCKEPVSLDEATLLAAGYLPEEAAEVSPYRPVGCDRCAQSGYKGRLGVFEVMVVDDLITRAFLEHAPAEDLREIALANGMIPMRRDALDKVAAGITSLEEVDRAVI